jgi:transcriptional regulator with XRE-family HTH domain
MNQYVTGAMIRKLREKRKLTQQELAEKLHVSPQAISKWETGQGFPDISLLEPLASVLEISLPELFSGQEIENTNRSFKMQKGAFYICPVCGNVIFSSGEALISCCGITLPSQKAENPETEHEIFVERVEDEYYVTLDHPMTRDHHISFLAALGDDQIQLQKLYPEQPAEARFKIRGVRRILAYCKHHGLYERKVH